MRRGATIGTTISDRTPVRSLWVAVAWACSLTCAGQTETLFRDTLQLDSADYTINFRLRYEGEEALRPAGPGILELAAPGPVFLTLGDYRVSGPSIKVARSVTALVEFPPELGKAILLSNGTETYKSPAVAVGDGRHLSAPISVTVYRGNAKVREKILDASRTFQLPQAVPDNPVAERDSPSPTTAAPAIRPDTNVDSGPPPYELDYRRLAPEAFVAKWPGQRAYVRRALARIPLTPRVREREPQTYVLDFDHVRALRLREVIGGEGYEILEDTILPPFGHRLVVRVIDAGLYQLRIVDTTKVNPETLVPLDNLLTGEITRTRDSITFTMGGGNPPYALLFYTEENVLARRKNIGLDTIWQTDVTELRRLTGPGTFRVQLRDAALNASWDFDGEPVVIGPKVRTPDATRPYLIGAGLLLAGVLVYVFRQSRRRRRASRIRENLAGETPVRRHVPETAPPRPLLPTTSSAPASAQGKMKVTRRARVDSTLPFPPDLRPHEFLPLDLGRHWTSRRVSVLYFERSAIAHLDGFLRRENINKIVRGGGDWERNEAIPEIGGMLMGQFRLDGATQEYRVSVEQFVALEARVQNVVKVDIDPLSLARDLGQAQDENPEMTVVGWFHTHPGHGLFLSQPDLKVHYGHFRQPYHFAMEIDSLSDRLDTAFFTYRHDGQMNNRDTRLAGSTWFSWNEIETFTRRNTRV